MRGSEKVKTFLKNVFIFIKEEHSHILTKEGQKFEYTEEKLNKIIKEISILMLFQDIIKICMKKAYDSSINIESNNPYTFKHANLDTNFLKAKQTDLIYPMLNFLNIFMTSVLLNDLGNRNLLVDKKVEYIIEILKLLERRYKVLIKTDYKKNMWLVNTSEIAHILLNILEATPIIKEIVIDKTKINKKNIKSHKIYIFDHKLDNSIAFSKHLPRIISPKKAESSYCVEE